MNNIFEWSTEYNKPQIVNDNFIDKVIMCWWDEAFTINEMLEETNRCKSCHHKECPNCGKE